MSVSTEVSGLITHYTDHARANGYPFGGLSIREASMDEADAAWDEAGVTGIDRFPGYDTVYIVVADACGRVDTFYIADSGRVWTAA